MMLRSNLRIKNLGSRILATQNPHLLRILFIGLLAEAGDLKSYDGTSSADVQIDSKPGESLRPADRSGILEDPRSRSQIPNSPQMRFDPSSIRQILVLRSVD